jgi:hypothetical protein
MEIEGIKNLVALEVMRHLEPLRADIVSLRAFLEHARGEDKQKYNQLMGSVDELKEDKLREEGRALEKKDRGITDDKASKTKREWVAILITLLGSGTGAEIIHLIDLYLGKH